MWLKSSVHIPQFEETLCTSYSYFFEEFTEEYTIDRLRSRRISTVILQISTIGPVYGFDDFDERWFRQNSLNDRVDGSGFSGEPEPTTSFTDLLAKLIKLRYG